MEQKEFVYDPKVRALANIAHLAATKPCSILEAKEILEREYGVSMEGKKVDGKLAKAIHEQIFSDVVYGKDGAFHMTWR